MRSATAGATRDSASANKNFHRALLCKFHCGFLLIHITKAFSAPMLSMWKNMNGHRPSVALAKGCVRVTQFVNVVNSNFAADVVFDGYWDAVNGADRSGTAASLAESR